MIKAVRTSYSRAYGTMVHVFAYFSVNTLRIAKPEKGQKIEAMLIQMAQTGQLGGKIGEEELIGLLGMNFGSIDLNDLRI